MCSSGDGGTVTPDEEDRWMAVEIRGGIRAEDDREEDMVKK